MTMTAELPRSEGWKFRAECVGEDPELFFDKTQEAMAAAVAVCDRCPVIEQCLSEALAQEGMGGQYGRYGIRGGLTPEQRFKHPERPRKSRTVKRKPDRKPRAEVTA